MLDKQQSCTQDATYPGIVDAWHHHHHPFSLRRAGCWLCLSANRNYGIREARFTVCMTAKESIYGHILYGEWVEANATPCATPAFWLDLYGPWRWQISWLAEKPCLLLLLLWDSSSSLPKYSSPCFLVALDQQVNAICLHIYHN